MAVDTKLKLANLEQLGLLGSAVKGITDGLRTDVDKAFKSLSVSGNTVSLYTNDSHTGTAAATFDFPTELFLDQAKTTFVANFTWSNTTYPGSTDPSLNGKPVIVLAVRGTTAADRVQGQASDTVTYSFINVQSLVDVYTIATDTVSAKVLSISNNAITFKISSTANNALTADANGLYVNITGKADKVTGATANNLASLDTNGNLADSGIAKANVLTNEYLATNTEATTYINTALGLS